LIPKDEKSCGVAGTSPPPRYTAGLPRPDAITAAAIRLAPPEFPDMSTERTLVDVKTALAEKYERLARLTRSDTRKKHYANRALRYRRQVLQMGHGS
jgi:hypothetical protein